MDDWSPRRRLEICENARGPGRAYGNMESIFETIVRHENDHTNLLRNILDRYPNAASVILTYLLGAKESPWDASKYEYTTQSHFHGDDGRAIPDIQIEGPGFRCLIEVKVGVTVPFTKAQQEEYAGCFQSGIENHLCYLVPAERQGRPSAPDKRRKSSRTALAKATSVFSTYLEPLLPENYSLIKGTQHAQQSCGRRFRTGPHISHRRLCAQEDMLIA